MTLHKCPGFDPNLWRDKDIIEVPCPKCGKELEFWKDDLSIKCPGCEAEIGNPMIDAATQ